jgi:putative hydrolase of the HAD superfamily
MRGAVLLDALGTLVTFAPPAPRLRALLAERHGVAVSEPEAAAAMRAEIRHYRAEHDAAVDAASLAALRRDCARVLRDALPARVRGDLGDLDALTQTLVDAIAFAPYPEAVEVLQALRARGHPLAVVSNWDVSLREVLERTGLAPLVDAVVISAELGVGKPDPRPFQAALEALGASAQGAAHVGDTYGEDVVGARAAGVRPVLVVRDGATAPADGALVVIDDLRGLLTLDAEAPALS